MACEESNLSTLSTLIWAFVDLAIVCFSLCWYCFTCIAQKLLGFLGFPLLCSSHGLFGIPTSPNQMQPLLLNGPVQGTSSIRESICNKFPFHLICAFPKFQLPGDRESTDCKPCTPLKEKTEKTTYLTSPGAHRSSSWPSMGKNSKVKRPVSFKSNGSSREVPSSGWNSFRASSGSCHPRRSSVGCSEVTSILPEDGGLIDDQGDNLPGEDSAVLMSASSIDVSSPYVNGKPYEQWQGSQPRNITTLFGPEVLDDLDIVSNDFHLEEADIVKNLKKALVRERTAHAATCLELEKERNASATAADEAMSMILRLQKEKSEKEMEARQFQRIVEEKCAYDEEEMNILKEILVGYEKERFVLEKELNMYRQIAAYNNRKSSSRATLFDDTSQDDRSDNPMLLLKQIGKSIEMQREERNLIISDPELDSMGQSTSKGMLHDVQSSNPLEDLQVQDGLVKSHTDALYDCSLEIQEKDMGSTTCVQSSYSNINSNSCETCHTLEHECSAESCLSGNQVEHEFPTGTPLLHNKVPCRDLELERHDTIANEMPSVSSLLQTEKVPNIVDVYRIDEQSNVCEEMADLWAKASALDSFPSSNPLLDTVQGIDSVSTASCLCQQESEQPVWCVRSGSTLDTFLQVNCEVKPLFHLSRGNSISTVEDEKLKVKTEVGKLEERLKIIREEREKLSFSIEIMERQTLGNMPSQLLCDPLTDRLRISDLLISPRKHWCRGLSILESDWGIC